MRSCGCLLLLCLLIFLVFFSQLTVPRAHFPRVGFLLVPAMAGNSKICAVATCKNTFAISDSHAECYIHRECQITRELNPLKSGVPCRHCRLWSARDFTEFRKRRNDRENKRKLARTASMSPLQSNMLPSMENRDSVSFSLGQVASMKSSKKSKRSSKGPAAASSIDQLIPVDEIALPKGVEVSSVLRDKASRLPVEVHDGSTLEQLDDNLRSIPEGSGELVFTVPSTLASTSSTSSTTTMAGLLGKDSETVTVSVLKAVPSIAVSKQGDAFGELKLLLMGQQDDNIRRFKDLEDRLTARHEQLSTSKETPRDRLSRSSLCPDAPTANKEVVQSLNRPVYREDVRYTSNVRDVVDLSRSSPIADGGRARDHRTQNRKESRSRSRSQSRSRSRSSSRSSYRSSDQYSSRPTSVSGSLSRSPSRSRSASPVQLREVGRRALLKQVDGRVGSNPTLDSSAHAGTGTATHTPATAGVESLLQSFIADAVQTAVQSMVSSQAKPKARTVQSTAVASGSARDTYRRDSPSPKRPRSDYRSERGSSPVQAGSGRRKERHPVARDTNETGHRSRRDRNRDSRAHNKRRTPSPYVVRCGQSRPNASTDNSRSLPVTRRFSRSPSVTRSRSRSRSRSGDNESRSRSRSHTPSRDRARQDEEAGETSHTFKRAIELLLESGVPVKAATKSGPLSYPQGQAESQSGRSSSTPVILPPHNSIQSWYDFAEDVLQQAEETPKNSPYVCPSFRKASSLYNVGKEGEFLLTTRDRPHGFREISTFSSEEAIKKQMKNPLTLQTPQVKAVEKAVRIGLCATSYSAHFQDAAAHSLSLLQDKVAALAPPDKASSATCKAIDAQKQEMSNLVGQVDTFLTRAKAATFDSVGSLTSVDVNMTICQRDKFVSRLRGYLAPWHAKTLRHSGFRSKDLMPGVPEVIVKAQEDATHESTRQVASHFAKTTKPTSRGPSVSGSSRQGGRKRGHSSSAQTDNQPFRQKSAQQGDKDDSSNPSGSRPQGNKNRRGKKNWRGGRGGGKSK